MPLLEGTDGIEKMSKSLGNYIGIDDTCNEMYSKAMSIPDEIEEIMKQLESGKINPRDIKMKLAKEIVKLYHGQVAAEGAEKYFKSVFQKKNISDDIKEIEIIKSSSINEQSTILKIITNMEFGKSNREAKRLVEQGAVELNGEKISVEEILDLKEGDIIQCGKRNFVKVIIK